MGESGGLYRVLVWKPEGKRPLGLHGRRWKDYSKMDLGMDWIEVAQVRNRWLAFVNAVMNIRVP
jgi:hypothetical protein